MKLHQFVLFTMLAFGGVPAALAQCYSGERVIVEVGGVDRIGTQIICNGQITRVELEPPVVERRIYTPPPVYYATPPVYYTSPPAYIRQYNWQYSPPTYDIVQPYYPPPTVYLGRGGVSVGVPGVYFEFGGGHHHHHH